jgi:hypothetical protein
LSKRQAEIQMDSFRRSHFIKQHDFLFEQFNKRVLAQFELGDIETAADAYAEDVYEELGKHAPPDADPGEYADYAYEERIEFGLGLMEMREHLVLSGLSYLYHQWDKNLREFLERELSIYFETGAVEKEVWKPSNKPVFDILMQFGFDVTTLPSYEALETLRLVVNVFKHGKGNSLTQLKARQPSFFNGSDSEENHGLLIAHKDHNDLEINADQFVELSNAIRDFWKQFPDRLFLDA